MRIDTHETESQQSIAWLHFAVPDASDGEIASFLERVEILCDDAAMDLSSAREFSLKQLLYRRERQIDTNVKSVAICHETAKG